eukprot:CAMPEP_0177789974 /NCGR_PEP_ID=MMETSP0491_2-20121128/23074_1 /TAXON_ID=63592 /ORGANISM="Tetraselmis chuii, Strain PLY429" /LENGTH=525 /DNA_ID=CAMNT_0019311951 /DNA_START=521 /DNA_END=2099 /DNA_ORIENTATION=-
MLLVEVEALAKMQSPFIIRYHGSFMHDERMYIVTEYAEKGDLHCFLRSQEAPLPEPTIWRLLIQVTMGLHHMHSKRILHRDVKSLNIFLDANYNVKIGDMGISKIMGTMTNFASTLVGTPYYLSPELCEGLCYDEKSDMWALGIVLYECCTCGKKPFDAESLGPLVMQIMTGAYSSIQGYSDCLLQIIDGLLAHSAEERLDTHGLLNSSIFRRKAEEVGIDLSQAARDLSVDELESNVMRFSMGGSDNGFDSKNICKGPPRIQARGARMGRGGSGDEPFNGRRRPPASWPGAVAESGPPDVGAVAEGGPPDEQSDKLSSTDEPAQTIPTPPRGVKGDYYPTISSLPGEVLYPAVMSMVPVAAGLEDGSIRVTEHSVGVASTHLASSDEGDSSEPAEAHAAELAGTAVSGNPPHWIEQPISSNVAVELAGIRAEELPETDRAKAVYFANLAIKEDESGAFETAFHLYQESLKYFQKDLKKVDASKTKVREVLTKKMVAYLERAEYLKQVLVARNLYRTASARGRRR